MVQVSLEVNCSRQVLLEPAGHLLQIQMGKVGLQNKSKALFPLVQFKLVQDPD